MKYFIDSANIKLIDRWASKLGDSFAGITTNLTMIKGQEAIEDFINNNNLSKYKKVMFQVENNKDVSALLACNSIVRKYLVAKVSILEKNFDLINQIKSSIPLSSAGTTCYDLIQINQAIEMGMDYTMVYYAKNEYKGLLEDAIKLKKDSKSRIKLVAASLHTPKEVAYAIYTGIEYCTVRPDVLALLFNDPQALKDIEKANEK